jgi:hypothetical protein
LFQPKTRISKQSVFSSVEIVDATGTFRSGESHEVVAGFQRIAADHGADLHDGGSLGLGIRIAHVLPIWPAGPPRRRQRRFDPSRRGRFLDRSVAQDRISGQQRRNIFESDYLSISNIS